VCHENPNHGNRPGVRIAVPGCIHKNLEIQQIREILDGEKQEIEINPGNNQGSEEENPNQIHPKKMIRDLKGRRWTDG